MLLSYAAASLITTSLLGMEPDAGAFGWSGAQYDKASEGQFQAGLMLCNNHLKPDGPMNVLELGSGTGRFAKWLALTLPEGSTVLGIDNNRSMIDEALRKQQVEPIENLKFQLKDARELLYDLNFFEKFEAAISVFCLHWIPSEQEMIDTMKGVVHSLKPGGKFIAIANIQDHEEHAVELHKAARIIMNSDKWRQYYDGKMVLGNDIPLSKYQEIIAGAGLKGEAFIFNPPARTISDVERKASLLAIPFGQVIPQERHEEFFQDVDLLFQELGMKNEDGTYQQTIPCIVIVAEKANA